MESVIIKKTILRKSKFFLIAFFIAPEKSSDFSGATRLSYLYFCAIAKQSVHVAKPLFLLHRKYNEISNSQKILS